MNSKKIYLNNISNDVVLKNRDLIAIEYTFQIMLFAFLHILTRNEAGQSDNVDQSYISC